jgi:hypothetical protein
MTLIIIAPLRPRYKLYRPIHCYYSGTTTALYRWGPIRDIRLCKSFECTWLPRSDNLQIHVPVSRGPLSLRLTSCRVPSRGTYSWSGLKVSLCTVRTKERDCTVVRFQRESEQGLWRRRADDQMWQLALANPAENKLPQKIGFRRKQASAAFWASASTNATQISCEINTLAFLQIRPCLNVL